MAVLFYQGHSSVRITSDAGKVCFIDPYAGVGYQTPCDLLLITHEHFDHNDVSKITPAKRMVIQRAKDMHQHGVYYAYSAFGFHVQATQAYNEKHNKDECVGYIIDVDGVRIYHAGDTGITQQMEAMDDLHIDYALLPIDGIYTMTPEEASRAADEYIKPRFLIPIHSSPSLLQDIPQTMKVTSPRAILVRVNEEIRLEPAKH